jgi:hypothetical protein
MVGVSTVRNDGPLSQLTNLIRRMSQTPQGENRRKQLITESKLIEGAARHRIQTELQSADSAVKAHEKAHMAILGGAAASGIQYTYARGPGGTRYAVGGSIKIDFQPVPGNPRATLDKARRIRMAALAPGAPSAADLRVAARAYRLEQQAQEKIEEEKVEERAAEREEARDERNSLAVRDTRADRSPSTGDRPGAQPAGQVVRPINQGGEPYRSESRQPVDILA